MKYFVNLSNNQGLTPIHYACFNGNIDMAKLLEKNGANIKQESNSGLNILHFASQGDQPLIFFYFMGRIDFSICDVMGNSPLHWACYNGSEKVVSFLLANNAEKDMPNNDENTPLHIATTQRKNKIVKKLLIAGANRHLKNKNNKTPI